MASQLEGLCYIQAMAEGAVQRGAALKDRDGSQPGLIRLVNGRFERDRTVSRAELAYALVGVLGLHDVAAGYAGDVYGTFDGGRIRLDDSDAVPADLRGYVQLTLEAGLLNAQFVVTWGRFDREPTILPLFGPAETVTRADYAVAGVRLYDAANPAVYAARAGDQAALVPGVLATAADEVELALEPAAPNPFRAQSRIAFSLAEAGPARLAVARGPRPAPVVVGWIRGGSVKAHP